MRVGVCAWDVVAKGNEGECLTFPPPHLQPHTSETDRAKHQLMLQYPLGDPTRSHLDSLEAAS